MKNDYVKWLCGCIIMNCVLSSVQIYRQGAENKALQVRVAELEDRITIADESARQIQREALEHLKKRKEAACQKQKHKEQSL